MATPKRKKEIGGHNVFYLEYYVNNKLAKNDLIASQGRLALEHQLSERNYNHQCYQNNQCPYCDHTLVENEEPVKKEGSWWKKKT